MRIGVWGRKYGDKTEIKRSLGDLPMLQSLRHL